MIKGRNFCTSLILLGILLVLGISLTSCEGVTGFFSNSWGEGLKRDSSGLVKNVNASNVKDMVKTFAGDPEGSKALLEEIIKKAKTATGDDKVALQSAGLNAAINASGLGTTILSSAGEFLNFDFDEDDDDGEDKLFSVLEGISDVTEIVTDIKELFGEPNANHTYPITDSKAGNDLVMGAMICLLGDFQEERKEKQGNLDIEDYDIEDYFDDFADNLEGNDDDAILGKLSGSQQTAYYLLKTANNTGAEGILGELLKEFHF